jgi:GTP-binding protein HflX
MHLPVFGIVGYTNAGKSSLMRALCKKEAYVADKLFATLGTEVGKMYIGPDTAKSLDQSEMMDDPTYTYERGKEVLVIDTIGFIRDLPPQLIKAFASTLEDSVQSDILLHVIDASDPDRQNKIQIVSDILSYIKANQTMIYVFNKSDQIDDKTRQDLSDYYYGNHCVFVSALTGEGLAELQALMMKVLR